jgi:phosphoserine phosphatase RsbU/P
MQRRGQPREKDPGTVSTADTPWKDVLHLGEELLKLPDTLGQRAHIEETTGKLLAGEARLWFNRPVYPLPGEVDMEVLPDATAPDPVQRARLEKAAFYFCQDDTILPAAKWQGDSAIGAAVPLFSRETLMAVLEFHRPARQLLTRLDLDLLHGLASSAALALEVSRQEKIKNWRYGQLALVRQVTAQIANFLDVPELCTRVTDLIQRTFGYYYVAIFTLEPEKQVLCFRASAQPAHGSSQPVELTARVGEGIIGSVAASGEQIVAEDVLAEPRYNFLDVLPETLSEACFPLRVENQILGVLDVQSDSLDDFHEVDVLVLGTLADSIAVALQNANLYSDLRLRAEQISSVYEVSHALNSILDYERLLEEIVLLIQRRFGYPHIHIFSVHLGRRMIIYQAGSGERSQAMLTQTISYPLDATAGIIPWVARSGETYLANDVTQDPLYIPSQLPPFDTRAELAVPLKLGDEVIGVLDIQSAEPIAFSLPDRSLFEALASTVAIAYRNATLYRAEKWRRQVAESFRDVAYHISSSANLEQTLDMILSRLETNLPCDAAAIWLIDSDFTNSPDVAMEIIHKPLRLAAVRGAAGDELMRVMAQSPEIFSQLENVLSTDQPYIRAPSDAIGPLGTALGYDKDYSSIVATLHAANRPLGLLTIVHRTSGRYGSEAQSMTATFASYAAVAILNTRLYTETQQQAWVSTMLLQVAEASQTTLELDDLLATMLRMTRLLAGVRKCAFLLREEGMPRFMLKAWHGFEPADGETIWVPETAPALVRLDTTRIPLYLTNAGDELALPELDLSEQPSTLMLLPLLVRSELIGAYLVSMQHEASTSASQPFDRRIISILQGIAHQTSITVENLRLVEAHREEGYVTASLLQVAQAVVSSSSLEEVLQNIVDLLPNLVGTDICVIYLWDPISKIFRPSQVYASDSRSGRLLLETDYTPADHSLLDAVLESGSIFIAPADENKISPEHWPVLDVRPLNSLAESPVLPTGTWLLGFPLTIQDQVLGVLVVREPDTTAAFWERRMEIITGIAQQASLAIQNDLLKREMVHNERTEREIQLARQIQQTFLPDRLPQPPGWDVDVRWETARQVGGDFYDVFPLDNNLLGLVIADVSDKGLPAALYMTVTRTLIRSKIREHDNPADVLKEVNELLFSESPESMFITAVYGILHVETGELVYANAGHNRPYLFHSQDESVEQLPKGGMALGVLPEIELSNHSIQIFPGDILVFYTDGASDTLSPQGEEFSETRLRGLLTGACCGSSSDLLEHLDQALEDWRQDVPPVDDVTLIALRREL